MTKFTFVTKNIKPLIPLVTKSQFVAKDLPIYMLLPYFISTFNSQFHPKKKKKNLQLPKYHNPNDADTEKPNRRRYRETQPVSMNPHQTIANKPSQNHRRYHQTVVDITIPLLISPFHRRFPHSIADFIIPLLTQPFPR